ncbi:Competence protein [Bartonella clarridgeiae 73]|uniref:Competence protein n=1 Tax=Bartonella clarridgeiae (strain CCUG 45776 / CIP 104772 / 73) TaxID=696125 RepID=E6YI56_BARC7|nr:ComEC/Rec2 family competence protein [Bartonella clarridgeiae]WCR54884.1 MAG: DNA internalization-related competence protein ComEC/Rec2 [Bartonella clarridgeiae]CBI76544.1 Competence protein [Bartonella clarridgeiae 73]
MLDQNKVEDDLSRSLLLQRKSLVLIQKGDRPVIDVASNATYNGKEASLFAFLKEKVVFFWKWLIVCINKEVSFGLLFLLVLVFFSTGIIFYFSLEQEPSWKQFVVLIIIFIGLLYVLPCYRKIWIITGFLFCIVLGALAAKIETWHMSTPMLSRDVVTILTGRIVSINSIEKGGFRLKIDVLRTEKPTLHYKLNRAYLVAKSLPYGLAPGDGLYGKVKLRALSGAIRPGSYDFSFHNYFKRIGAQGFYLGKPTKILVFQPNTMLGRILQKIENLRMQMTQKIIKVVNGEEGRVSAALITGQRGGISNNTNEALRIAGLAHILSISGLHMALLSGMVFIIVRSFFAFFPVFSSYYSAKKFAAIAALIVTAFYLVLSGANIAAQRSFLMVAVMLIAILCNRSAMTMRNFAIAGLITMAVSPHEILGPSFQMSFSATAALIASFCWWSDGRFSYKGNTVSSYIKGKIFRFVFLSIVLTCMSSLIAGFASGIYAAYHFSNVALLGVISNTLALPIVSIFIIPFGLISAFAMFFGLEWLPLKIMGFGTSLMIKIAYAVKAISPVLNPGFIPLSALILLSIGLVGLTFLKTAIRFFFSFFILGGILVCMMQSPVQLIIADNMKIVGVLNNDILYIDRYHPSKFTTSIWEKSFRINKTIKPTKVGPSLNGQFICDDNICTTLLENGFKIAILYRETDHCVKADIIIRKFTTSNQTCNAINAITFTPQQLLSRGSVILTKNKNTFWSSAGFYRPWNIHRKFIKAN